MTNPYVLHELAQARHRELTRAAERARRVAAVETEQGDPPRRRRRPRWHR